MRTIILTLLCLSLPVGAGAATLFAGLEGSTLPTRTTDLTGFPDVTWTSGFAFDVSGAAATPDGGLYLCEGAFTTHLYAASVDGHPPELLCTTDVDLSALAYGRGTLYGYSNYATPKGIYAIDPTTGAATLVVDVYTVAGLRFFALDYNPADDHLYGYSEYGDSGLYAIDIDTGEMVKIADPFEAVNTQGRAMAVGNDTVYILSTRGDDGIPCFAYDLGQGPDGEWVPFTNPYPDQHATGGAAFIPDPGTAVQGGDQGPRLARFLGVTPNPFNPRTVLRYDLAQAARVELRVFDAAGRLVRTLRDGVLETAGSRAATWDGRDGSGRDVPAGVYLVQLRVGAQRETRRAVLVR